jgi:hypothetical protein
MYIGDEVQMGVSGGTAPFVYTTDNPAVAVISDVDRVRAVGPGTTRVRVTDAKGEVSVTTGLFDVRAIKTDMEEVSVWPADTFYVPVKLRWPPAPLFIPDGSNLPTAGDSPVLREILSRAISR